MVSASRYRFTPDFTPGVVRWVIWLTCGISIASAWLDSSFQAYLNLSPQWLLSLSLSGWHERFLWQPLTYLFVQPAPYGITFELLINLLIVSYLIWMIGTEIAVLFGSKAFLRFYLFCGVVTGVLGWAALAATHSPTVIAGAFAATLSLFVVFAMIYPNRELLFFFIVEIPIKILLACLVGGALFVFLAQGDLVNLTLTVSAIVTAYLYAKLGWGLNGPYQWMRPMDHFFDRVSSMVHSRWVGYREENQKIVTLKEARTHQQEEEFVDKMLEKISKEGKNSLSWLERRKLDKISQKRGKNSKK
jgi:membrane associated rhomboid family serine protease